MTDITVFTPTYNRAYTLEKLFTSLKQQTFKNFEWIIVDDGSTDETERLVRSFLQSNLFFNIVYIKTEHQGKHYAINTAVRRAKGQMFFIVDSDDYLTSDALKTVMKVNQSIPKNQIDSYAGVCGLRGHYDGSIMGTTFDGDYRDLTTLERTENGISGDKAEVFYTSILKKYPFPEFEGENFLTECVVWDKIASDHYKLRFFNEIIYFSEYLQDGLTKNLISHYRSSPKGYGLYIKQSVEYGKLKGFDKWTTYLNYFYMFREENKFMEIAKNLGVSVPKLYLRLFGMRIFYKLYS